MNSLTRRPAAVLGLLLVALLATLSITAGPANAAAFRFWSYWQGASGEWVIAQTGPADHTVTDQDVQGWRFGITTAAPEQTPDNEADFAGLCPTLAAEPAPAGQVRVAVVVDAGFTADAPEGQTPPADKVSCVTVAEGSTGSQALAAATTVTEQNGMVCALNGFPAGECAASVSDADAAAAASAAATEEPNPAVIGETTATEADSGTSWGLVLGLIALAALAAAALLASRRRAAAARPADDGTDSADPGAAGR